MSFQERVIGGKQEPAELAFGLGAAANRFRWNASQAYLYGSGKCYGRAVQTLGEMRSLLAGLGPNTESAIEFVRALIDELQTNHGRSYHVQARDGLLCELTLLRRGDDAEETMAAACFAFLEPVRKRCVELDSVLRQSIHEHLVPTICLGRLTDQLVRPLHVHRAAVRELTNEVAVECELNPFDLLVCTGTAHDQENANDVHDALSLEPELDESYSSEVPTEALIGTEVADGSLVPEPGILEEICARWPNTFGRELRLLERTQEFFTVRGNVADRLRAHKAIVACATVNDPEAVRCEVNEVEKSAIVEGKEIHFGNAREVFKIFLALKQYSFVITRDSLVKIIYQTSKQNNLESLSKCVSSLNKRLEPAQVCVFKQGNKYCLRRCS